MIQLKIHDASFKDPDAQVYNIENEIFRTINFSYKKDYDLLMNSGLYEELLEKDLIVKHVEVENFDKKAYKTLKPEKVFISYPYEWCFSQYKDCALAYLKINQIALKYSITLKDASAYNMQFYKGKPLLIDTSSFEEYKENDLWKPYGQFSRHFLAPLLLMHYTDLRLSSLMKSHIDGIPLDLCAKLLPFYSRLNPAVFLNIFLHSSSQKNTKPRRPKKIYTFQNFNLKRLLTALFA